MNKLAIKKKISKIEIAKQFILSELPHIEAQALSSTDLWLKLESSCLSNNISNNIFGQALSNLFKNNNHVKRKTITKIGIGGSHYVYWIEQDEIISKDKQETEVPLPTTDIEKSDIIPLSKADKLMAILPHNYSEAVSEEELCYKYMEIYKEKIAYTYLFNLSRSHYIDHDGYAICRITKLGKAHFWAEKTNVIIDNKKSSISQQWGRILSILPIGHENAITIDTIQSLYQKKFDIPINRVQVRDSVKLARYQGMIDGMITKFQKKDKSQVYIYWREIVKPRDDVVTEELTKMDRLSTTPKNVEEILVISNPSIMDYKQLSERCAEVVEFNERLVNAIKERDCVIEQLRKEKKQFEDEKKKSEAKSKEIKDVYARNAEACLSKAITDEKLVMGGTFR